MPRIGAAGHANENAVVQCKANRDYVKIFLMNILELLSVISRRYYVKSIFYN